MAWMPPPDIGSSAPKPYIIVDRTVMTSDELTPASNTTPKTTAESTSRNIERSATPRLLTLWYQGEARWFDGRSCRKKGMSGPQQLSVVGATQMALIREVARFSGKRGVRTGYSVAGVSTFS